MNEPRGSRRQRNAPTISDVAAHAGVSPMTVSRVINREGSVRDATRERVEEAIAALRYAPSAAARMLAGGEDFRLGVLHTTTSLFYFSEFLAAVSIRPRARMGRSSSSNAPRARSWPRSSIC